MYLFLVVTVAITTILFVRIFFIREKFEGVGKYGWNGQETSQRQNMIESLTDVSNPDQPAASNTSKSDIVPFSTASPNREKYLEDMVRYLLIVINMTNARQQLYKLENGYAQTFSYPRLDALEKQRQFFIEKVKRDPAELDFFRENLVVMF